MKKVIITGASSGIGEAIAEEYAKKGYSLGLIARRMDRLEAIKKRLNDLGAIVAIRSLDVADDRQILPTMESLEQDLGGVDIVIPTQVSQRLTALGKMILK